MIAQLKPYPAYKESDAQWLGRVPDHWDVHRLRNVAEMLVSNVDKHSREDEDAVRLCNYVDVYKNERITSRLQFMRATAGREEIERFRLRHNDVLITKDSETWDDIGVPALVEYTAPDLICGYHLALLRPFGSVVRGSYLLRALQGRPIAYQFHVAANGVTRYGLSHDAIKSIILPVPTPEEQNAIVRYLDHVDRRIQRYIRAKQKLIALLNEQKQAIIHRAVTRGLDPNVRLKPSSLEWLGDVPEHWRLKRFKFLTRIATGQVDPRKPAYSSKYLIAPNHVVSGAGTITRLETAAGQGADSGKYQVRAGEIIYSKIRPNLRKAVIAPVDCLCSADMYPISVDEREVRPRFLLMLLLSLPFTRFVVDCSLRVAMPKVNREALGNAWLWYPPPREQDVILDRVKAESEPLDQAITAARHQITVIREYRNRLIADLVTGKLDVREAAATLPPLEAQLEEPLVEMAESEIEGEDADVDAAEEVEA